MATGIVKWFSDAKGFGFIEPDDKGADVFAHFSAIKMDGFKTLKQGVRVSYELQDGPKGPHAQDITLLSAEPEKDVAATTKDIDEKQPSEPSVGSDAPIATEEQAANSTSTAA